jgi:hypothetical protein
MINIMLTIKSKEVHTNNILKAETQNIEMIIITRTKIKITKNMIQRNIPNTKLMINMNVQKIMKKGLINQMFKVRIFIENIGLNQI